MGSRQPERQELASWKEIADYLGVSVRAAQRWEVEKGLPVRRLTGERGRVSAQIAELDRWKQATLKPRWWASLKFFRIYAAGATVLLLLVLALALSYLTIHRNGPPARFRLEFKSLVVMDDNGAELWRKSFEDTFATGMTPECMLSTRLAWFGDLDGDGHPELLFVYQPAAVQKLGHVLICFSDTGKEKWRFAPGRTVSTATETYAPPFQIAHIGVSRAKQVVVSSHHLALFPNQVAVLSSQGRLLGEYWHAGHLPFLEIADLENNGTELAVMAGISNAYRCASVVVLDPRDLGGASVEEKPQYQFQGFGPGRERARLLFPRTCINRKLEEYNSPDELDVQGNVLRLGVLERPKPAHDGVIYRLTPRLELIDFELTDSLRSLHRQLEAAGQLDHPLTETEVAELRNIRVLKAWQPQK